MRMKFDKAYKSAKGIVINPSTKKFAKDFSENLSEIKKGHQNLKRKKTKLDKKLLKFKYNLDKGLGLR